MSDFLRPYESQHARAPYPSSTPGVYSDSRPSSQWCHQPSNPLLSPYTSAPNPSQHQSLFQWVIFAWGGQSTGGSALASFLPKIPGLISFRMYLLDLLAVQGTLKSLLQHHSSKASILRHSAFFTVHRSHPYMTPGETIALTRWTLLAKLCLCFWICYLGWS